MHICHCGKECTSYADFKAHLSSHIHNHLPSQGHSSNHGPGHGKERKWKCSMCPQAFISPSKLHVHFMGHMGMKPHKCDFCSKAFSDPSNLRTHLKIHTGEGSGLYRDASVRTGERVKVKFRPVWVFLPFFSVFIIGKSQNSHYKAGKGIKLGVQCSQVKHKKL